MRVLWAIELSIHIICFGIGHTYKRTVHCSFSILFQMNSLQGIPRHSQFICEKTKEMYGPFNFALFQY